MLIFQLIKFIKNQGLQTMGIAWRLSADYCAPWLFSGYRNDKTGTLRPVNAWYLAAFTGRSGFPLYALHVVALEQLCLLANEFGVCPVSSKCFLNVIMMGEYHK